VFGHFSLPLFMLPKHYQYLIGFLRTVVTL
jgi:hypothetical protein